VFIACALEVIALARHPPHVTPMTKRATRRPEGFTKPAHWSNAPAPQPAPAQAPAEPADTDEELSPTRYGDWVKNGIAIDF
jgi:hypothetical protein